MTTAETTKEKEIKTPDAEGKQAADASATESKRASAPKGDTRSKKPFRKNTRKPRKRRERPKPEFDHRVVDIRRVTRVVAGGRRFSFSVTLVAGDRKGRVGVGVGKAGDTALAIEKAMRDAKNKMVRVARTDTNSIAHEVEAKYASAVLKIFPTPGKGGLTAGSAVRIVLELAGIQDVGAKLMSRTKNSINIARASVEALKKLPQQKTIKKKESKADAQASKK